MEKKTNLLLFLLFGAFLLVYYWAGNYFWPPPPPKPPEETKVTQTDEKPPEKPEKPPEGARPAPPPAPVEEGGDETPVVLGDDRWHLKATLTPRGAGVQQLLLNDFQKADAEGRPVWADPARKVAAKLELIPEDRNRDIASFLLYHYPSARADAPLDTLGRRIWKRVEPEKIVEGQPIKRVSFETTQRGVKITKTYTLEPRDYHLGFEVKLELDPKSPEAQTEFRYQLHGAHGLPIEGLYYTNTLRNTVIAKLTANREVDRDLQDQRLITHKGGGERVDNIDTATQQKAPILYAGVQVQYFASILAVDQKANENREFLAQATPITLTTATRGKIVNIASDRITLRDPDRKKDLVFELRKFDVAQERVEPLLREEADVVIVHRTEFETSGTAHEVVVDILDAESTSPVFHDDVTVAVSTEGGPRALVLKRGEPIIHRYVIYNGPVKVRLLDQLYLDHEVEGQPAGAPAVDDALLATYLNELRLDTLTDYPSSAIGRFFSGIGLTSLVIFLTNVLHSVMWYLHQVIPVWGLSIVLLTVLVRAAMHPLSRKQAKMAQRMQELQPEIAKLREKYKDDQQQLHLEVMKLYRKYGANPLGSCWIVFLQMPVFLALYGALQESIHFRLAPFLWMPNLAAPDMLIRWGDSLPWSWPSSYGHWYYLGPYFNLLPIIAVALMVVQQKLTMPPPADEQQEMQMKMMKYMMIFMGFMFYKVAAGLAIYFIVSSLWGFAERKLLPKKKPGETTLAPVSESRSSLMGRLLERLEAAKREATGGAGTAAPGSTAVTTTPPAGGAATAGRGGKKKKGRGGERPPVSGAPAEPDGLMARLRAWWEDVLRQAEKR